jgi:tetratricopeptide (TPR) repeat protein
MTITPEELAIKLEGQEKQLSKLECRLAKIEGDMASSWALKTKDDYEKTFKDGIKDDMRGFIVRLAISAVLVLGGVGYVFIKSAVTDAYESRNKEAIADLQRNYEARLKLDQTRYDWSRFHNYGKDLIRVAEFYNYLPVEEPKRQQLVERLMKRSEEYFEDASRVDPSQGSTYYELASLKYSYPMNFNVQHRIDLKKAIQYYQQAIAAYSPEECAKGWRADAYLMLGTIYQSIATTNPSEKASATPLALNNLTEAKKEFENLSKYGIEKFKPSDLNDKLSKIQDLMTQVTAKPSTP